ncbi:DUF5304 family protein [Streptomyces sp. JJ66]|uniref:DUF5304 family protein n=1 Tax=Streptomyces sp. JJ66 TaxID=2803843 RepID=UPI001C5777BA|nr:DUF5304 family protein [Streptomyces sp. JJ66]MBW1601657.1 DUF5304 family protein [Streptomyces sp. JJ66]
MSDARGREPHGQDDAGPTPTGTGGDADAWADACAEDLAAERARRRARYAQEPGSAAEELRRLAETVAGKLAGLTGGSAAQGQDWARQVVEGARAAVEPVVRRNPQVFEHLSAAGNELLAAYRSAVSGQEQRWTRGAQDSIIPEAAQARDADRAPADSDTPAPRSDRRDAPEARDGHDARDDHRDGPDDPPGTERIDLD